MLIIPAIDLREGRCVRLVRGDFARETSYGNDPVRVARHWAELGAPWIHVVDLDGARDGAPAQLDLVRQIAEIGVNVELGGGLRSLDDFRAAFLAGARRVVIGTVAVENDLILRQAVRAFGPEAVVLGVDARDGLVATHGWSRVGRIESKELIERARASGVTRVIYTDIDRDGTLTSPNVPAIAAMAQLGLSMIASGGVASLSDLRQLAAIPGVEAAIVGKALYEGTVTVESAAEWQVDAISEVRGVGVNDDRPK
jgi:phosphoribosylformimino-5-aminoimidazole carboxamide ribotide isomerase